MSAFFSELITCGGWYTLTITSLTSAPADLLSCYISSGLKPKLNKMRLNAWLLSFLQNGLRWFSPKVWNCVNAKIISLPFVTSTNIIKPNSSPRLKYFTLIPAGCKSLVKFTNYIWRFSHLYCPITLHYIWRCVHSYCPMARIQPFWIATANLPLMLHQTGNFRWFLLFLLSYDEIL